MFYLSIPLIILEVYFTAFETFSFPSHTIECLVVAVSMATARQ